MARFFSTAGPCRPGKHYMLPPERRLPDVDRLIEQERYFVIHAPRQVGKTTSLRTVAERLTAEGRYTALLTSCEAGQKLVPDLEGSVAGILDHLRLQAEVFLPAALRPPAVDSSTPAESRLRDLLTRWARQSPRPVVLFLDEIDSLYDDALITVLRQLRAGFDTRPDHFPQSVALIGLRDVRDYKILSHREAEDGRRLGTASPFNVKSRSFLLPNFTAEEVAELYVQHTAETGQPWGEDVPRQAFEATGGQPWLVNALAEVMSEELVPDRSLPLDTKALEGAREILIERRDTHVDSLIDRLRERPVRKVLDAVLSGELLPIDVISDDVDYVKDLGLVVSSPQGLEIANPIYREIIPRALTGLLEEHLVLPRPSYVTAEGRLAFDQLIGDFRGFWIANAEEYLARSPYSEAAAHLVFMAFLHKITNGGRAMVDREYAAGRGRLDLCIRWPVPGGEVERFALELKVWRDTTRGDPAAQGREQLAGYLSRLGLDHGTLLVFDTRSDAAPLPERCREEETEHDGKRITVLWL